MSRRTCSLVLASGSALLALWIIARFHALTPTTGKGVSIGLGVATAIEPHSR